MEARYNTKIKKGERETLNIRIPKKYSNFILSTKYSLVKIYFDNVFYYQFKYNDNGAEIDKNIFNIKIDKAKKYDLFIDDVLVFFEFNNEIYFTKHNYFNTYEFKDAVEKQWIISEIQNIHDNNLSLYSPDVKKINNNLFKKANIRFDSWINAVELAGVSYEEVRKASLKKKEYKYNKEYIKKEILKLYNEGLILTSYNVQKNYYNLYRASRSYFKSWAEMLYELNIDHSEVLLQSSESLITCGFVFEKLVDDILKDLKINYTKYNHGIYKPDYVFNNNKWGDAKLSEWTVFNNCNTIENYEPHCRILTIIYYRGDKNKDIMISNKTRLLSVYKLIKQLPKSKRIYYINKLEDLDKKIKNIDT